MWSRLAENLAVQLLVVDAAMTNRDRMTVNRIRTAGIAVCFVLTSCGQGGGPLSGNAGSDVAVPPVDSTIRHAPGAFDDEFAHLVVTPIAASASESKSDEISRRADVGDDAGPLAQDRLRVPDDEVGLVPSDAVLVYRGGIPGYINELDRFVALTQTSVLSGGSLSEDDLSTSNEPHDDPIVEELLGDPAVQSVVAVGDGSYGVVTSDPSALDGDRFDVVEDIVLGLFEEPYEHYQWALNNTGTNLVGALASPPAQTQDSDVDGQEALALASGSGVIVAVIDSGVDFTHSDLADSSWQNTGEICGNGIDDDANGYVDDCRGWDFGYNDNSPYNSGADAHGTHVAGIITANINGAGVAGIAPDAKVMDLNVGGPGGISGTSIAGAVRYAVDNGADIINMSLGTQLGTPRSAVAVIESAVVYALEQDVLVVVAAGNDGVNLDVSPVYPASLALPGILVVGASTPSDERASFSNYSDSQVNVFAPGHYILSTMPGNDYQFMSGTSQASPLSAGAAALVMQQYPSHTPAQVIEQLLTTSNVLAPLAGLAANGGRVNALNAIEGTTPEVVVSEPTELAVSVTGLASATNELAAAVTIAVPSTWFADPYHWELTMLMSVDDITYALAEFPLIVADSTATTDGRGAVRLGDGGSLEDVAVVAGLPSGDYSFVIEAVADAEPDIRFGDAHVVSFSVSSNVVASDPPSSGSGSAGAGQGESAPTESGSGGSAAPGTTQPGATPGTSDGEAPGGESTDGGAAPEGSSAQPPTTSGAATDGGADSSGGTSSGSTSTSGDSSSGDSSSGSGSSTTESDETTDVGPGGASAPSNPGPDNDGATPDDSGSSESGSTNPNVPAAGSDQAEQGEWSVYRFSDQVGFTDVVNVVYLMGEFPSQPDVWFGEQAGSVIYYSPEFIIVETPVRSDAGIVDVTLRRPGTGVVLTLANSFGFVDSESGSTSGSGSNSSGTSGTGSSGSGSGSSEPGSSESGSSESGSPTTTAPDPSDPDSAGPDSGDGPAGSDTTVPPSAPSDPTGRQSRSGFSDPVDLPSGLRGVPLVGDDPTSGVTRCSADPCRAT